MNLIVPLLTKCNDFPFVVPFESILGQLMESFKKLLLRMKNLCALTLVDLVLSTYEANSLMDSICMHLHRTLNELFCINLTLNHCSFHQIGMLYNLKVAIESNCIENVAFPQKIQLHFEKFVENC